MQLTIIDSTVLVTYDQTLNYLDPKSLQNNSPDLLKQPQQAVSSCTFGAQVTWSLAPQERGDPCPKQATLRTSAFVVQQAARPQGLGELWGPHSANPESHLKLHGYRYRYRLDVDRSMA